MLRDIVLAGDAARVEGHLTKLLRELASYHDARESFYHGLVLGLLVHLHPSFAVRSNRESGYGRLDVQVAPAQPGGPGAVLELKSLPTKRAEPYLTGAWWRISLLDAGTVSARKGHEDCGKGPRKRRSTDLSDLSERERGAERASLCKVEPVVRSPPRP